MARAQINTGQEIYGAAGLVPLLESGRELVTLQQIIEDRNRTPKDEGSWNFYGLTAAAVIYEKGRRPLLSLASPFNASSEGIEEAKEAINSYAYNSFYAIPKEGDFYQQALVNLKNRSGVMRLPARDDFAISLRRKDVLDFIAGKTQAKQYLDNLHKYHALKNITLFLEDKGFVDETLSYKKEFVLVVPAWFGNPQCGSILDWRGRGRNIHDDALGVRSSDASEVRTPKISISMRENRKSEPHKIVYSPEEASRLAGVIRDVEAGNVRIADLRRTLSPVADFLEKLI